ncbi:inositol monophosphatase family protein [Kytococcus sedentarius]|uniref:Inositol monophosphatase/fructose-1,6-bisphosphatase family protein n=1 Tax=Kytococcus sedentarius (strain ATCC 14392 / DSM 20547 / JCM 11482 / CCUG 33030 / NBRC 15357 / NCTC 11040 / CCM 314 / 541) TaxID=478801 RepID=C7NHW7_KYTSD|nr:inositol monophosphatase family protein [Kytococcus sedentarius]ACV06474.1 inositol monophosphatase/fructose-1,6-bisphosphatase family protein [Kytococcus sedentarius DSM 20547]QQB64789.1 inositol monophosphatase family protein [Kytococcus sedentarius]STX12103.1 Inositol-1-monophosphatase [Kytococcus sedentarius]
MPGAPANPSLTDDAALAASLVRDAGQLAQRMRTEGVETRHKTSASDVVTAADLAAEELVVGRLCSERPADGIVGEEGAAREGTSGRTWVIDPVDGTFNFVQGLDWWCSALALADGGEVALGAVHHPGGDHVWVGGRDLPTTRDGVELPPLADKPLAECALATYLHTSWWGVADVADPFAAVARRARALRMNGSGSMDLAAVADGRMDLWLHHSVPEWDWMPGYALVEGAGGVARQVEVRGYTWSVAGPATAVGEVLELLLGE